METAEYLKKFKVTRSNERWELASEISQKFGVPVGAVLSFIKNLGKDFVRETFIETIKSDAENQTALFLWKMKECKIKWLKL